MKPLHLSEKIQKAVKQYKKMLTQSPILLCIIGHIDDYDTFWSFMFVNKKTNYLCNIYLSHHVKTVFVPKYTTDTQVDVQELKLLRYDSLKQTMQSLYLKGLEPHPLNYHYEYNLSGPCYECLKEDKEDHGGYYPFRAHCGCGDVELEGIQMFKCFGDADVTIHSKRWPKVIVERSKDTIGKGFVLSRFIHSTIEPSVLLNAEKTNWNFEPIVELTHKWACDYTSMYYLYYYNFSRNKNTFYLRAGAEARKLDKDLYHEKNFPNWSRCVQFKSATTDIIEYIQAQRYNHCYDETGVQVKKDTILFIPKPLNTRFINMLL